MGDDEHVCTQEVVLNTICIKLDSIEKTLVKIEAFQTNYAEQMEAVKLQAARYPTPENVNICMDKVKLHDAFFAIGGTGLIGAWGFLLWIADKFWKGG